MNESDPHNLYATRPDLYDVMHADVVDDMRFLHEFVTTLGDRPEVLELGCGTGRLLTAMLDAGATVTGIDREATMVEVARRRVAGYGDRARVLVADMRRFRVPQRFDMAVIGLNTFMHLLTSNDQLDCLACIHEHLRAAGVLLLDLANPHTILRDLPLGMMQHRFTRPSLQDAETTITLWSATSASPAEQIAHSHLFFDEVAGQQGLARRTMAEVTLRLTYRYELELLLARSGFAIRHVYGDYDSSPYDDDSERLICVAVALA